MFRQVVLTIAMVLCVDLTAVAKAETVKVHYGSAYADEVLTVFPKAGEGHRVVVLVHGGGWNEQRQETELTSKAEAIQKKLAATVVDVDYPQLSELQSAFPTEPEAAQHATEWALSNASSYGGDPARLSMVGFSAGAHLATLAAQRLDTATPGTVKAVVSSSGPMNLWRIVQENGADKFSEKVGIVLHCPHLEGCSQSYAEEWSPRYHIDAACPPELLGTYATDLVPRSQSEEMAAALTETGCVSKLAVVNKSGHEPGLGAIGGYKFLEGT